MELCDAASEQVWARYRDQLEGNRHTYALGSDPRKHRLCAELYAYAQRAAEEAGWLFEGAIAGHLVGEFPPARIPGDKEQYRISAANSSRMRDPDAAGQRKHWIIEVHLADHDRTFGGFYERLLVPADHPTP